jgi:phosphatidylglycerophosphate synthase
MKYSKLQKINLLHSYLLLAGFVADFILKGFYITPYIALFSFLLFLYGFKELLTNKKPLGGWANVVTLLRLSGVFVLIFNYGIYSDVTIGFLAITIISLDGLDGYLARKYKTESEFGAFLDMETDAFFVASMSYMVYMIHPNFLIFLFPGLLRYLYLVIIHVLGLYGKKESFHPFSKWFAVAYFVAVITSFLLPLSLSFYLTLVAGLGIVFSFSYSFVKLIRS